MDKYTDLIKVSVFNMTDDFDVIHATDVILNFNINIQFKTWGINGIDVTIPSQQLSTDIEFQYNDDDEEYGTSTYSHRLTFIVDKLNVEYYNSRTINVDEIVLYISPDFKIDYKHSYISVFCPVFIDD